MKLITGATGLVGSHLMVLLSNSHHPIRAMRRENSDLTLVRKVFNMYALHPEEQFKAIEWVVADLTDIMVLEALLEGVEEVYHCAAVVSFHPSKQREMILTNVNGTSNLVNALLHKGNIALCHVSSIAALGRSENNEPITEQNLWKNSDSNSTYSVSKYAAEREVWRGVAEGLNAVIVNPSVILGPGNWHTGSSELFSLVWKGLRFYTNGTTGYVDVRDVAMAMFELMQEKKYGQRFILSSETISFKQLFTWIAQGLQKKPPTVQVKRWMAEIAWRLMAISGFVTRQTPAITRETARTSLNKKAYSTQKITDAIGFEFIPIQESIREISAVFVRDHQV